MRFVLNWSDELKCIVLSEKYMREDGCISFRPIRNFYSPGEANILRNHLERNVENTNGWANSYKKEKVVSYVRTTPSLRIYFF